MSRLSRPRAIVATGLTLGTVTAGLLFAPAALAADTTLPALTVSPSTAYVGDQVTVSGKDCLPKDDDDTYGVVVYLDGDATDPDDMPANGELKDDGTWTTTLTFKANQVGSHTIDAYCAHYTGTSEDDAASNGHGVYPTAHLTVANKPAASSSAAAPAAATSSAAASSPSAATDFVPGAKKNTPGTGEVSSAKTTGNAAAPGQKVVKVIKGFKPGEVVTLVLHSTPVTLGTFTADANGVVTAEFTIPAGTPLGNHTLAFAGADGSYYESPLTLTADGKALAYTGADIKLPLIGGSVLLAAGAGALVAGRRRRTGAAQA